MRFEVIIPPAPARREAVHTIKAESEEAVRRIVMGWLGWQAARDAIVRPSTETLMEVVSRKERQA